MDSLYEEEELGNGVTMRPATQLDIFHIDRSLREMDRKEAELGHDMDLPLEEYPEGIWVILHEGNRVGYGGFCCIKGEGAMSKRRCFFFLSTKYVDKIKKTFVKMTPIVFRAIASKMPSFVDTIIVVPITEYQASIRWLNRVLGFRILIEVDVEGVSYTVMEKRRGEKNV